ncbi:hypothetical protein H1R20_g14523, partial [Candolleomyces eurysporus]
MAFAHASHFTIGDAQFINAATYYELPDENDALRTLLKGSAINATTESAYASYAPTCHPSTRQSVTNDLMTWARGSRPDSVSILWLSGPAGGGKTCILRRIVELCKAEDLFAACVFFSTCYSDTRTEGRFIITLAAQLTQSIPQITPFLVEAVKKDPTILQKSLETQMKALIFGPLEASQRRRSASGLKALFRSLKSKSPQTHRIILIDGLDECVEEKEQAHILRLVHEMATHPHFPFRFVIASRPEYTIRTMFSSPPLSDISRIIRLETYEADRDIHLYLQTEFARLRTTHPASTSLPAGWPLTEDGDMLVSKASGQFVYVATVVKHLANPRRNPVVELRHILDLHPGGTNTAITVNDNPFSELDALYMKILHRPNIDIPLLKSILHAILHNKGHEFKTPSSIDAVLGFEPGTCDMALMDLHSVVAVEPTSTRIDVPISFHHKSLADFLMSPGRAGDLYQSRDETHLMLAMAYYRLALHIDGNGNGGDDNDSGPMTNNSSIPTKDPVANAADNAVYPASAFHHAILVENWSLFETEFVRDTLPKFVEQHFFGTVASAQWHDSWSITFFWGIDQCSDLYHQCLVLHNRAGLLTILQAIEAPS